MSIDCTFYGAMKLFAYLRMEAMTHIGVDYSVVHSKMIFLICYLLDYQQVHDNTNVSIILLGDKKEPTK